MTAPVGVRFGVNYVLREGWFHGWLDLDRDSVARDLDTLAGLGIDHVRIFPLWPLLQPARSLIRPQAVTDLVDVVDLAIARGLDVALDGLQGHLSGFDFLPTWVTQWRRRNLFTDPDVVQAQRRLLTELAQQVADRPQVMAWTIGNETNQFAVQRHPERYDCSPSQMADWLRGHVAALATGAAPGTPVLHSFDDDVFFDDSCPVTPEHATTIGDITAVHSWVFTRAACALGEGHPDLAYFADYLIQLAIAHSPDPDRPVWLQEIGAPIPEAGDPADFLEQTVRGVLGTPQLTAITWWCSHDIDESLPDFRKLEYTLGLVDAEGTVKETGKRFAELIAQERREPTAVTSATTRIVLPTKALRADAAPGGELFRQWLDLRRTGERVAIERM